MDTIELEFVRKPFIVKVVPITKKNIAEHADKIGELMFENNDTTKPYIQVDRRKIREIPKVFPGYFMTVMGNQIRCYSPRAFKNQFVQVTPEIREWVDWLNAPEQADVEVAPGVTVGQNEVELHIHDQNAVNAAAARQP